MFKTRLTPMCLSISNSIDANCEQDKWSFLAACDGCLQTIYNHSNMTCHPNLSLTKKKIGQFMELTARYLSGCFIDALNIKFWKKIKQHGFVSSKLSQYIQLVVQAVVWDFLINGVLD